MRNNIVVVTILIAVIAVGAGFFAGMKYQEKKYLRIGNFQGARGGMLGGRVGMSRFGGGFRPVNGEVIGADDKSITVKLQDGSSRIVLLTDSTEIGKATEGSKSDLKVGEKVAAFGTENSDGSITAQSVQLNPQFRGQVNIPTGSK